MSAPVAWRWNGGGANLVPGSSSSPGFAPGSVSNGSSHTTHSTYSLSPTFYVPSAMNAQTGPNGLVLIPSDLAEQGRIFGDMYSQQEGEVDPRKQFILLSQDVQDLESKVDALTMEPIDLTGAQQRVAWANGQLEQFLVTTTSNLTTAQKQTLQPLYDTASTAQGAEQQQAQTAYDQTLDSMLTAEQRKTYQQLNRTIEDAQLNLQAQQIGQRIIDARAGKPPGANDATYALKGVSSEELLSLAMADARALVAQQEMLRVDRIVQDMYALVITPQNMALIESKQLTIAQVQQQLAANPDDPQLQQALQAAQSDLDQLIYGFFDPNDRSAVQGWEAYQRQLQSVSGVLAEEADNEFSFYQLRGETAMGPTEHLKLQTYELAKHKFEFTVASRTIRAQALQLAASPDDEKLSGQFEQSMIDGWKRQATLQVEVAQLDYDVAVSNNNEWLKTNPTGANTYNSVQNVPYTGAPPTVQALDDARAVLDQAKQQQQQLLEQLKPQKVGFWDRVLDVSTGVLEIIGGVITMVAFSMTGVGAVIGAAMIVDGAFRTAHSVVDWQNGTTTDAPLSAGLQHLGVSRRWANGVDMGVQLIGSTAVGGTGSAFAIARGATMLKKGGAALGLLSVADGAQAGARSIWTGKNSAPYTIQWLQTVGLSQTQANYVMAAGGLVAMGGAASVARFRTPGTVTAINDVPGAGSRTANWYSRGAPKALRTEIAEASLPANASPKQIRKVANSMNGSPLVVLSDEVDGVTTVVGAAKVKTNTVGWAGRDNLGHVIAPHSAEIKPILGTGDVLAQTIAAGVKGTEQFTKQGMVFWQTKDADDASLVSDATIKHQRIRQDAPGILLAMQDSDRPWGTTKALTSTDPKVTLTTQQQMKNLAAIPDDDRVNWPANTLDMRYQVDFTRPLSTFGSETFGKIIHPLHKDSWLSWLNNKLNPVNFAINKWWPKPESVPQKIGEIRGRKRKDPVRISTYYPAGTMPDELLTQFVAGEVNANASFGDLTAFNRHPEQRIPIVARNNLKNVDLVIVTDVDPSVPGVKVLGGAGLTRYFRGIKAAQAPAQFPWMSDKIYRGGTTYLGHVFGNQGAGGQAVAAAAEAAKTIHGARHFDFLTQWSGAQKTYQKRGAKLPGGNAVAVAKKKTNRPNVPMQVYDARFSTQAAQLIKDAGAAGSKQVQRLLNDANGSVTNLQTKLDGMSTEDAYAYATQSPDGALLVRYELDFNAKPGTRWQTVEFKGQDLAYGAKLKIHAALNQRYVKMFTSCVVNIYHHVLQGAQWLNEHFNPTAMNYLEPGKYRGLMQDLVYGSHFLFKQSMGTGRGMLINLAGVQAATGNVHYVRNDDRALYPFNGLPGSTSRSLVFSWTGTMVSLWWTGPNFRAPKYLVPIPGTWVMDQQGLMPLYRFGPSLATPNGPKSPGVLYAVRATPIEVNGGIRWFGTNNGVSAVSAVSFRPSPLIGNGRIDVPIPGKGGPRGLQAPFSWTMLMPTVSHAVYFNRYGMVGRSPHVSLAGIAQTTPLSAAEKAKGLRGREYWFAGSTSVSTGGWGYFATLNPAYGKPDLIDYGKADKFVG